MEQKKVTLESIDQIILRSEGHSTAKEAEFLVSVRQQFIRKGSLSCGQLHWLNSIEARYSEQFVQDENKWAENWSEEHRLIACRVAQYYNNNPPYYSRIVSDVLADPDSAFLSKRQWNKFCENKYALRIRSEYETVSKFKKGDCVQIRATHRLDLANYSIHRHQSIMANKVGFVIKMNAQPITRAAKGSRVYQILLAGNVKPIYAHESDLKKAKGVKNV